MRSPQRLRLLRGLLVIAAITPMAGCLHDQARLIESSRLGAFDLITQGQALKARGDFLLARDLFLKASESSPRPVVFYEIGNCYYHLENYPQALAYYDKAIELAPDYELAKAERDLAAARDPQAAAAAPRETPIIIPGDQETGPTLQLRPTPQPTQAAETVAQPEPTPAPPAELPPPVEKPQVAEPPQPQPPAPSAAAEPPASPAPATANTSPATPGGLMGGLTRAFASVAEAEAEKTNPADLDPERVRLAVFPELYQSETETDTAIRASAIEAERLGRQDEAARLWRRILEKTPEDVEARLRLAKALQRSGRTWRAQEEIALAEKFSADNAEVQFEKGTFLLGTGDKAGAEAAFRRALVLDPGHLKTENNLAVLEMGRNEYSAAAERLQRVVAKDPDFAASWMNLALAQDGAGQPAAVVAKSLENYVRLSPETSEKTATWLRSLRQRALLNQ